MRDVRIDIMNRMKKTIKEVSDLDYSVNENIFYQVI